MFAQGLLVVDDPTGEWKAAPRGAGNRSGIPGLAHGSRRHRRAHCQASAGAERDPHHGRGRGGTGCRPEVLSHVHGISRLHAAAVCDALVDRQLLMEEGGSYRCAHPVIGHVVRDGLSPARRSEVHRALAVTLEQGLDHGEPGRNGRGDRPSRGPRR